MANGDDQSWRRSLMAPEGIQNLTPEWGPRGGEPTPSLEAAIHAAWQALRDTGLPPDAPRTFPMNQTQYVNPGIGAAALRPGVALRTVPAVAQAAAPAATAALAAGPNPNDLPTPADLVAQPTKTTAPAAQAPQDLPIPQPAPRGVAPIYENAPDPWTRAIDPVGPGFHREPTLVNNVWQPPPGGSPTEDNPRWHEGTPAYQAQQQQFINRGQMAGIPTTRREAMAALPGSPLETSLQEYYKDPTAFPGRIVPSPVGPSTGMIQTLRGGEPGAVHFYNQQQLADQRARGIHLGLIGSGFEWNEEKMNELAQKVGVANLGAAKIREAQQTGAAHVLTAQAHMKQAETGAKTLDLARAQGHPERVAQQIKASPSLLQSDAWRVQNGLPPRTAVERMQALPKEGTPEYTLDQAFKADLSAPIILREPLLRPQALAKIKALEKGFDPDAFFTRRHPPKTAKTPQQKAAYAFSQITDPARRERYRNLYLEYQKMTQAAPLSNP